VTLDEIFTCFENSVAADRLAQAYLLIGPPRGAADRLAARVLQLLFCEREGKPCGACRGCRTVEAHTHPDVLWVEPEKKSRAISIAQVRGLQGRVFQTTSQGGWKACVIVSADRMGVAAANAFLKTLEEPPPRSLFLLLSDSPNALLPTIVSRCQWVLLTGVEAPLPDAWLDPVVEILAGGGREGPLGTMATTERLGAVLKELKAAALADEAEKSEGEATEETDETLAARAEARYRELRTGVLRAVIMWYRDLVLLVSGADEGLLHYGRHVEALRVRAAGLGLKRALQNVAAVADLERQLERNLPEGQALSFAFSRLD
jgi:DNA polymerase-3 subunit delta'